VRPLDDGEGIAIEKRELTKYSNAVAAAQASFACSFSIHQ
jgi:hypothetical protein